MAYGLQVFNCSGAIRLDLTKRILKIWGSKTVTGTGTLTSSSLGYGNNRLWYFITNYGANTNNGNLPLVRISTDCKTISWKNIVGNVTFSYGVY